MRKMIGAKVNEISILIIKIKQIYKINLVDDDKYVNVNILLLWQSPTIWHYLNLSTLAGKSHSFPPE